MITQDLSFQTDINMCLLDLHSPREGMFTRGVQQGSTLEPLLFPLYVNDMYRSVPDLSFIHYADDTTISF